MANGVKIEDYPAIDRAIGMLRNISEDAGEQSVSSLIAELDSVFVNTNSNTANKLLAVRDAYTSINDMYSNLASNAMTLLQKAKTLYQETDSQSASDIN